MFAGPIVPALVTPLTPQGEVDEGACHRLLDHVVAGGAQAVLALGSTGESATLGADRRSSALVAFAAAAKGRVRLAVGVTEPSLSATLVEARKAVDAGAEALVVTPPYYAPVDQKTVIQFYEQVAAAVSLPLLAYNIPSFTKTWIEPPTMQLLLESGVLSGVKDSSADMEYLTRVMLAVERCGRSDVLIYTGMDMLLLVSLVIGATGAIAASSNFAPRLSVDLHDAVRRGDLDSARELQRRLVRLIQLLRAGPLPQGIKSALSLIGICGDTPAAPVEALPADKQQVLADGLRELGFLEKA